jgi:hypothetical protein
MLRFLIASLRGVLGGILGRLRGRVLLGLVLILLGLVLGGWRRRGTQEGVDILEDVALGLLGLGAGIGLSQLLRCLLGIADDALEYLQGVFRSRSGGWGLRGGL